MSIATRIVTRIGAFATSLCLSAFAACVGATIFSLGAGILAGWAPASHFMGLGFAALNSMQQARLVAAGPHLASATVALNTSLLYVGQAIGSGIGGVMILARSPRAAWVLSRDVHAAGCLPCFSSHDLSPANTDQLTSV